MFTHLHTHTVYSLLDGANRIPELVSRAKELGQTSLAITDHGTMGGIVPFYDECHRQGIKPIIGCEVYVAPDGQLSNESSGYDHLVLLAKNEEGYRNLCRIVTDAELRGFNRKPRTDEAFLKDHHEGLVCMSACMSGAVPKAIADDSYSKALGIARRYRNMFGDDYYIEVQDHGIAEQKNINRALISIANVIGAKIVATNDAHYLRKEDWDAQDTLMCIQTDARKNDTDRMRFGSHEFYIKSEEEMREVFPQEYLDNTQEIADKCSLDLDYSHTHLPDFDIPQGYRNDDEYLRAICEEGMKKRYGDDIPQEYAERLDYELGVIEQMGFAGYFLIVQDAINWAKDNDIAVGPSRGSAGGSIVAYTSGITDIDPMKYDLLFERFLNPERVTMPDIDVDVSPDWTGRYQLIEHLREKYGAERVSQVATYNTLNAKSAFRKVAKAYDVPYQESNRISKLIPAGMTLAEAIDGIPDLRKEINGNDTMRAVYGMAMKEEGMLTASGKHAGGVLITDKAITDYAPLARSKDKELSTPVIEYVKTDLEELGLIKIDFLGLRNLQVIKECERAVERNHGKHLDMSHFSPDEHPEIFSLFRDGRTYGVFQFESEGITKTLQQMFSDMREARTEPEKKRLGREYFDRLVATNALYRPGPIDYIPEYLENMRHPENIHYDAPQLEPILKSTYGVIVYQEQVQQIFRDLAGYSLGQADVIRRYISKKKLDKMNEQKSIYLYGNLDENGNPPEGEHPVPGCVRNGVPEQAALAIWEKIEKFASYAFNKSHSVGYSLLAAETAYLKQNYPHEFMAAQLTSFLGSQERLTEAVARIRNDEHIPILTPSINESRTEFTATHDGIRYGFAGLRDVGRNVADAIVEERERNGAFASPEEFCLRMKDARLTSRNIKALALSGAFDGFGISRRQLVTDIPEMMKKAKKGKLQLSIFDADEKKESIPEYGKSELLSLEKEYTGLYLSGSPLDGYGKVISKSAVTPIADLDRMSAEGRLKDKQRVNVACILSGVRYMKARNGSSYMKAMAGDDSSRTGIICFSNGLDAYSRYSEERMENDSAVIIGATVELWDNGGYSLTVSEAEPLLPDTEDHKKLREACIRRRDFVTYGRFSQMLKRKAEERKTDQQVPRYKGGRQI